jgi:HEAT repeat protein
MTTNGDPPVRDKGVGADAGAQLPDGFMSQPKSERLRVAKALTMRTPSGARGREMIGTWSEGGDPTVIPALSEIVRADPDVEVRRMACGGLARMTTLEAVPGLLDGMRDIEKRTRYKAVAALGRLRAREAVPGLIDLLGDKYCGVAAAEALVSIRDARGLDPIRAASRHGSPWRRRRLRGAAEALATGVGEAS